MKTITENDVREMIPIRDTFKIHINLVWDDELVRELSFNDYISLMRNLKVKAFVTLWTVTINKMNIVKLDVNMSPHVAMAISDFVHEQKTKAFDTWFDWEYLYREWCKELPERNKENRRFTIWKNTHDGD